MNRIVYQNIHLGGLADSMYSGPANSVAELVGFNIHGEPGILKNNQALVLDNDNPVASYIGTSEQNISLSEPIIKILTCSDGNTYLLGGTNGLVYKRDNTGNYYQVTSSPIGKIFDAIEFDGYIYYAYNASGTAKLGRVGVGAGTGGMTNWQNSGTGARTDAWATFVNNDQNYHPMIILNDVLYIGDGKYIAQVDGGVFSTDALTLPTTFRTKCLGKYLTDLLAGTFIGSGLSQISYNLRADIFRWNTWSVSFTNDDDSVSEVGVNSFLRTDGVILASAGIKGNIYSYNGTQLSQFKKIPGDYLDASPTTIYPNAILNFYGLPLFGFSGSSPNGALINPPPCGIYSLGGHDRNYPKVLNLEWLISNGQTAGVTINAVGVVNGCDSSHGGPTMLVAWSYNNGSNTVFGIDRLAPSTKVATAHFTTRVINVARGDNKALSGFVAYRSLPDGCAINIYYKAKYATSWTPATIVPDTNRNIIKINTKLPEATAIQIKVESVASGNTSPEIESAEFDFE